MNALRHDKICQKCLVLNTYKHKADGLLPPAEAVVRQRQQEGLSRTMFRVSRLSRQGHFILS